jgi:hypothetical protein
MNYTRSFLSLFDYQIIVLFIFDFIFEFEIIIVKKFRFFLILEVQNFSHSLPFSTLFFIFFPLPPFFSYSIENQTTLTLSLNYSLRFWQLSITEKKHESVGNSGRRKPTLEKMLFQVFPTIFRIWPNNFGYIFKVKITQLKTKLSSSFSSLHSGYCSSSSSYSSPASPASPFRVLLLVPLLHFFFLNFFFFYYFYIIFSDFLISFFSSRIVCIQFFLRISQFLSFLTTPVRVLDHPRSCSSFFSPVSPSLSLPSFPIPIISDTSIPSTPPLIPDLITITTILYAGTKNRWSLSPPRPKRVLSTI